MQYSSTKDNSTHILLALNDIARVRLADREVQELLRQKEVLLQEMQHRVANSLSISAAIPAFEGDGGGEEEEGYFSNAYQPM